MKLKEGSRYIFDVEKCMELGNKEFYVLKGPDNRKYLLNKSEYFRYNIKIGTKLDCRVDKINCKGEIFLEPLHPYYTEGDVYDFIVVKHEELVNKVGERVNATRLRGNVGDEVILDESFFKDNMPDVGLIISLNIHKISKGQISIADFKEVIKTDKEEEEEIYDFILIDESPGLDNKDYYIVKDKPGQTYTIRKDYYKHYNLKIGEKFKGRFIRYKDGEDVNIEPLNPWFEPGSEYSFTVKSIVKYSETGGFILLGDSWGRDHKVAYREDIQAGEKLVYRVEKMRKGWPLLIEM